MRFPLSKIYRAFPEFDPFPDDECERYICYAYRQARFRIGCLPLLAFGIVFVAYVSIGGLVIAALDRAGVRSSEPTVVALVMLIGMVGVPAIVALLVRDRILLRVLSDRIKTARCPQCEFSLLGLPVKDGSARCPECGMNINLRVHNLKPEDLLIRRIGEEASPEGSAIEECPKCRINLRGVQIHDNTIRCPECGHVESLLKRAVMQRLHAGRIPEGFVDQSARITTCPGCAKSLIGLPIFEGQTRCMECEFIANVVRRPGDGEAPAQESASAVGLRIKRSRGQSADDQAVEHPEP